MLAGGALLRAGPPGGDRQPRDRRGHHRLPRDPAHPQEGGGHAGLRPAEAGRAGPGAGARAAPAAPRRAHGRDERRGEGGHGPLHPRHQRGPGHHHDHDRARHGRGDGRLAPGHGPLLRREDRRRDARGGPGRRGRPGSLPRRRRSGSAEGTTAWPTSSISSWATTPSRSSWSATPALHPDKVAMREKEFGIWQPFTWREYHDHVRDFSLGLVALGMQPGDKVAIIGDNRPEWVWAEMAAQAAGGASVGLYQDSNLTEVAFVIDHCDATFVVAEDQEQVDKILDMLDKLPKVRERRLHRPARPAEVRAPEAPLLRAGRGEGAASSSAHQPGAWEEHVRPRPGRRRGHHLLHLGDHRLPQGGDALLPEPALHGADPQPGGPQAPRPTSSSPSCRWPGSASR